VRSCALQSRVLTAHAPERNCFDFPIIQVKDSESRVCFSFTHDEIADLIGTSRKTVTRALSNFKILCLVAFKGSMITIPSRTALEEYAHAYTAK
jgi:CRP-like cAMP-binding protein